MLFFDVSHELRTCKWARERAARTLDEMMAASKAFCTFMKAQ